MVGRGGGKNMGSRNKDGKGCGGQQTMDVGSRRPLNQAQNKGNRNIPRRNASSSNQVQNEGNLSIPRRYAGSSNQLQNERHYNLASHNQVESLNQMEHPQNHDVDMNLSRNQLENESEGFISPKGTAGSLGKRKRINNLLGRLNMTLEGLEVVDPPMRRDEHENVENRRNRRREDQVVGNRGSAHSATNEDATPNGEATSKVKHKGERGKYKSYVIDMKMKGKTKLKNLHPG